MRHTKYFAEILILLCSVPLNIREFRPNRSSYKQKSKFYLKILTDKYKFDLDITCFWFYLYLSFAAKILKVYGPNIWNFFPQHIKNSEHLKVFQITIKKLEWCFVQLSSMHSSIFSNFVNFQLVKNIKDSEAAVRRCFSK